MPQKPQFHMMEEVRELDFTRCLPLQKARHAPNKRCAPAGRTGLPSRHFRARVGPEKTNCLHLTDGLSPRLLDARATAPPLLIASNLAQPSVLVFSVAHPTSLLGTVARLDKLSCHTQCTLGFVSLARPLKVICSALWSSLLLRFRATVLLCTGR